MAEEIPKVYLVGAGPGDPGLITLRGAECLRRADVVLYDYLAGARLLLLARPDAELVCLGRHGHGRLMSQADIHERMIREARAGKTVVRLKGGDPGIFGRLAEEQQALEEAGIPYEIVPGITAVVAAASHAGISLTHREQASCVAFVTGQESPGKSADDGLDYAALAQFPGTLVFYMGVTTASEWSRALTEHGKSPNTPVTIVRRCSLSDQETIQTTLAGVAELMAPGKLRPPVVAIIGEVAQPRRLANWFTSRPLFGRSVLVTRPERQADAIAEELADLGAQVHCQPAIEILSLRDPAPLDRAIAQLADYDWLVFSSSNGVRFFFHRLQERGSDLRLLGGVKLAAIGPATVAALAEYHLTADVQPESYRAESLAEALAKHAPSQRFLLARASRGREVLARMLTAAGGRVDQVVVYESRDVAKPDDEIAQLLSEGLIDWTTVTSSAIARSLVKMFGKSLKGTRLAAISPLTAEVLSEAGYPPAVVADHYTSDGLVKAILRAEQKSDD